MSAHPPGQGDGRKIEYDDAVFYAICERHARGENLLTILAEPGMPEWGVFFDRCCWRSATRELQDAYERAQVGWASSRIHQAGMIADNTEEGIEVTESEGPKGKTRTVKRSDMLGHRSLKIRSREWFAERILRAFTAKHTLQNPDGTPIMRPSITLTVLPEPKEG